MDKIVDNQEIKLMRKLSTKPKIGFAVLAHNRSEYLELCLDSLFKTKLYDYDVTFLIQDDGSDDPMVKEIIEKPRNSEYKIVRSFTQKGHDSWGAAFNKAMRKLLEIDNFDIIGSCDSDALFHPQWLDHTMKICLWAKENHKEHILGPFSSFNSSDYMFHKVLGTYESPHGKYVVKERMGALNYFYFKEDFLKLGFYPEDKNDETLMTEKFKGMGIRYFSTNTSFVEHIGQESVLNQWRPTAVNHAVYGMNLAIGDWGVDLKKIRTYPPKVSVIMPVYNREKYLKESVDSILNQTYEDFEFIIVDDGSEDKSLEIIKEYAKNDKRIVFLHNKYKKGIVGGLMTAIESAQGEYIVRMDSDDVSMPERIEKQVAFMDNHLDIGACGTWVRLFGDCDEEKIWELPVDPDVIKSTMFFCGAIANPSAIIRRKIFSDFGYSYDDTYTVAEDYDFWTRIVEFVKLANIPEVLLLYRIHPKNTGSIFNSEHAKAPLRIYERQIRNIGIIPNGSDLNIHKNIGESNYNFKKNSIKRMEKWLDKVINANNEKEYFQKVFFNEMIAKKRLEIREAYEYFKKNRDIKDMIIDSATNLLKDILPQKMVNWLGFFVYIFFLCVRKIFRLFGYMRSKILLKTEKNRVRLGFCKKMSKKVKKNYKIGMAVLVHERPEYLDICLDSLFKTELYDYDITFLLNDDGSKDQLVRKIVEKNRDAKYKIVRNFTPKGPNCAGAAINKAVKKLMEIDDFDIIGWCDSDALFHPQWLDQTMKICLWAKDNHKDHVLGPFSSFNSSDYIFHKILGEYESPYGKYVVKRQMGMLNYFYFKEDFLKLGYFPENKDDETLMTKKFEKNGVRNFCTHTSYVEHLGQDSVLNQWRPTPLVRAVHGMNLAEGDWGYDMEELSPYAYYKYLKGSKTFGNIKESKISVDIILLAVKKDLNILPQSLASIRKYLKHPIGNIIVVAPNVREITEFCEKHGCIFRDEDSVLPVKLKDIRYVINGVNRSGWIFQQLLKLSADSISDKDYVYVLDVDTVLLQPQKFEYDNKNLLLVSDEYHLPYMKAFKKIFGYDSMARRFSFVAHQMFFNLKRLKEMKKEIEEINGNKKWYEIILDKLDHTEASSFSEYETYGNWMIKNHPEDVFIEYWFNKSLPVNGIKPPRLFAKSLTGARSVSFHSYNRKSFLSGIMLYLKNIK